MRLRSFLDATVLADKPDGENSGASNRHSTSDEAFTRFVLLPFSHSGKWRNELRDKIYRGVESMHNPGVKISVEAVPDSVSHQRKRHRCPQETSKCFTERYRQTDRTRQKSRTRRVECRNSKRRRKRRGRLKNLLSEREKES